MAVRVSLSIVLSAYEAFRDLVTFAFVALHLFYAGRHHSSAVAELLRLIEILGEINTKVQGVVSSPYLATTLIYGVSRQWS